MPDTTTLPPSLTGGVLATIGPDADGAFATFTVTPEVARALGPHLFETVAFQLGGAQTAPGQTLTTFDEVGFQAAVLLDALDAAGPELEQAAGRDLAPLAEAREALRAALNGQAPLAFARPPAVEYVETDVSGVALTTAPWAQPDNDRLTAAREVVSRLEHDVAALEEELRGHREARAQLSADLAQAKAQLELRTAELNTATKMLEVGEAFARDAVAQREADHRLVTRFRDALAASEEQTHTLSAEVARLKGELDDALATGFKAATAFASLARALGLDPAAPVDEVTAAVGVLLGRASGPLRAHEAVLQERRRQLHDEGYTPEHDDLHEHGQLAFAAAAYLWAAGLRGDVDAAPEFWPFSPHEFRVTSPRAALVKGAALALAELERHDRAAAVVALPGAPPFASLGGK